MLSAIDSNELILSQQITHSATSSIIMHHASSGEYHTLLSALDSTYIIQYRQIIQQQIAHNLQNYKIQHIMSSVQITNNLTVVDSIGLPYAISTNTCLLLLTISDSHDKIDTVGPSMKLNAVSSIDTVAHNFVSTHNVISSKIIRQQVLTIPLAIAHQIDAMKQIKHTIISSINRIQCYQLQITHTIFSRQHTGPPRLNVIIQGPNTLRVKK